MPEQGRRGGFSPPAREGNPSLREGGEFVLGTSVTFICNSPGGEWNKHMESDPSLA